MKIALLVFFCCFSFQSLANPDDTEATIATNNKMSDDACCDREIVTESAQDMSQAEAQRITRQILAPSSSIRPMPRNSSDKGQR